MARIPDQIVRGARRREEILRFIARTISDGEGSPTVREVGAAVDLKSTKSVHDHLKRLESEGYLERSSPTGSRRIRLTERGWETAGDMPMLGRIAAGRGLEAVTIEGESYSLAADLLHTHDGRRRFVLRVVGQSMTGAGIEDGDILVVEENEDPQNGSVVVALLNNGEEVTVKRFYRMGEMVKLVPQNGNHQEIVIPAEEVLIQGEVAFVIHPPRR